MKKIEETLFVRFNLEDELQIKRTLLEISESLLLSLSSFEDLKDLAKEKKQILSRVKTEIKEIKESYNLLEEHMPKAEEKAERKGQGQKHKEAAVRTEKKAKKEAKKEEAIKREAEAEKPEERPKTKKMALRKELEDIRERLKSL